MDHVVYLDFKADELSGLLSGTKTMLIRGAAGRKMPYGRVSVGDTLYFINNNGEGVVKASGSVKSIVDNETVCGGKPMPKEESTALVEKYKGDGLLNLTADQYKRWAGKRYLVIIEVEKVEKLEPFEIDKSAFGNMDDWFPVGEIGKVRI